MPPAPTLRVMDRELFEHYLARSSRRGPVAGRRLHGRRRGRRLRRSLADLARRSRTGGSPRSASTPRAAGRRGPRPPPSAEMVDGAPVLDGGPDRHRRGRRGDRRPDPGQAPRRPARRRRPAPRPGAAPPPRSRAPRPRRPGAPSRVAGRDVRRRRQRRRRAARARARGRGGRRHAQALGRPRDRRRQGLLLAGGGARRPRRSPTRSAIPHFTLDLEEEFRRRVVGRFIAGYAAGGTPNPCVALQRRGADRGDGRPRRAARRHAPGHRPLRPHRRGRRRAAARRRRRRGQGPELHARRAAAGAARPARASRSPS